MISSVGHRFLVGFCLFFYKQNKAAISILNMSLFDYLEYAASVAVPFEKKTFSSYYTIIRGSGNAVYTEI